MKLRLRIHVDETDLLRLDTWAHEHGVTRSRAVEVAVRALLCQEAADPLLELSGDIEGLPADQSASFGTYLERTFP